MRARCVDTRLLENMTPTKNIAVSLHTFQGQVFVGVSKECLKVILIIVQVAERSFDKTFLILSFHGNVHVHQQV